MKSPSNNIIPNLYDNNFICITDKIAICDITRTFAYDLHGWLTAWSCGTLSQSLAYASGTNPSYTGRISAKSTQNDNSKISVYNYSYDKLGRLIAADFKQPSVNNPQATTLADYSTAYTYDLQGNILTLKRKGPTSSKLYGVVDDITATYQGNQIATLRDDASNVLLESSLDLPHGEWSGSDFAYDRNGNQTRDLSRGVADIVYNELNLPARVEMDGGGSIEYLYSAAGTKLAEIVRDEDNQIINRRDYAGMFEYEADSIERIALASGYVTVADTVYHLYAPDYQGNIVAVYNTATGQQEHYKDHYPYGLPHAEMPKSSSITPGFPGLNPGLGSGLGPIIITPTDPETSTPSTNRRWYGAKELTTDHGLNTYDFEARSLAPAFPRFTTPDPLAEKYKDISPYAYCGSDPINYTDPSGRKLEFHPSCSDTFKAKFYEAKQFLSNTTAGKNINKIIAAEDYTVTLVDKSHLRETKFKTGDNTILWDPFMGVWADNLYFISPAELLGHEADHAVEYNENPKETLERGKTKDSTYGNAEEKRAIENETETAHQLNRLPEGQKSRENHRGTTYDVPKIDATEEDIECP